MYKKSTAALSSTKNSSYTSFSSSFSESFRTSNYKDFKADSSYSDVIRRNPNTSRLVNTVWRRSDPTAGGLYTSSSSSSLLSALSTSPRSSSPLGPVKSKYQPRRETPLSKSKSFGYELSTFDTKRSPYSSPRSSSPLPSVKSKYQSKLNIPLSKSKSFGNELSSYGYTKKEPASSYKYEPSWRAPVPSYKSSTTSYYKTVLRERPVLINSYRPTVKREDHVASTGITRTRFDLIKFKEFKKSEKTQTINWKLPTKVSSPVVTRRRRPSPKATQENGPAPRRRERRTASPLSHVHGGSRDSGVGSLRVTSSEENDKQKEDKGCVL